MEETPKWRRWIPKTPRQWRTTTRIPGESSSERSSERRPGRGWGRAETCWTAQRANHRRWRPRYKVDRASNLPIHQRENLRASPTGTERSPRSSRFPRHRNHMCAHRRTKCNGRRYFILGFNSYIINRPTSLLYIFTSHYTRVCLRGRKFEKFLS